MSSSQFPTGRKVDYLSFEEFSELLREVGYPHARWWERVRAELSMRGTFQQWFKRLAGHMDDPDSVSPVLEMHCSPQENPANQLTFPGADGSGPLLIRYPYKKLNLMSEGLTFSQLAKRESLVYSSSFTVALRDETINPKPLMRAAKLIHSAVMLWREIATGKHMRGIGADGLEAACLHDVYSTNRIPASSACDVLERRPYSSHIVIAWDGLFFPLTVVCDGAAIEVSKIFTELRHLELDMRDLASESRQVPVGALTTMERDKWHYLREELSEHPQSGHSLEQIESALFVVCLDLDFQNENRDVVWRHFRDMEAENRWYDKSLQVIVTGAGSAALTFDESAVDMHVASQYADRLWEIYESDHTEETTALVFADEGDFQHREPLEWGLSEESLWNLTAQASSEHSERRSRWQHSTLKTRSMSRDFFEQEDINPDAVLHIVFQLAFCAISEGSGVGLARMTQTRHVEGGRYSLMPVLTPAVQAFVESCLHGAPTREGFLGAVESLEGRLIRLQSGWDLTGMFKALSCFAAEGDLIDRVESMSVFQEGLNANPLVRVLLEPNCITSGNPDHRAVDFVIPSTAGTNGVLTISYVIRRGYCRIDVWAETKEHQPLQKFCALVENGLRQILKVMGEH